jgi:glutamine cyclotransferase
MRISSVTRCIPSWWIEKPDPVFQHAKVNIHNQLFRLIFYPVILLVFASRLLAAPEPDYTLVKVYPHDHEAFTEGLLFQDGFLYESTGEYGSSSLRKVELKTGKVVRQVSMPRRFFGEGLALLNGKLYQLTWQNHVAFVYDFKTFDPESHFDYPFEGWGLTTDGKSLIASDGSEQIRFLNPATFKVERTIDVVENGQRIVNLNELEYIHGQIFANVWKTDRILKIDPATGKVLRDYNLSGLLSAEDHQQFLDVLNGIAYDPDGDHLYVTGKLWPKLFEIKLKP